MLFSKKKLKNSKEFDAELNNIKAHDFNSLMGQVRRSNHRLRDVQKAFSHLKKNYDEPTQKK